MSVSKRKSLPLIEKIEIINYHQKHKCSSRILAEKFKIGKTQASEIVKKKDELLRLFEENSLSDKMCRFQRSGIGELIDKTVLEWFNCVRSKKVPISGPMIQDTAQEIARQLKVENFKASNGWLHRFRTRHNIVFKVIAGEGASMNVDTVRDWKSKIKNLIDGYEKKNIYSAAETGLFYRVLPNMSFCYKGETCSDGEKSNERLTVLLCTSMTGEKEKPLIIGKYLKPTHLKGIRLEYLGVDWNENQKAWMTSIIMRAWLEQLNRKMGLQGRKIVLFLNNTTAHSHLDLENVKLIFFPQDIVPTAQPPLNQGIIQSFKTKYREYILQYLIANLDNKTPEQLLKGIDILKAVTWIEKAWIEVTSAKIINSFEQAGFPNYNKLINIENENIHETEFLDRLMDILPMISDKDYASIDNNLATECSSEDITEVMCSLYPQATSSCQLNDVDTEFDSDQDAQSSEIKNYTEALDEKLTEFREFYKNNGDEKCFFKVNQLQDAQTSGIKNYYTEALEKFTEFREYYKNNADEKCFLKVNQFQEAQTSEVKNYTEALEKLTEFREFYKNNADEKCFLKVNQLQEAETSGIKNYYTEALEKFTEFREFYKNNEDEKCFLKVNQLQEAQTSEIKNYTEALEKLTEFREFYKNHADEKCFFKVNQLIIQHEEEMARAKLQKQTNYSI